MSRILLTLMLISVFSFIKAQYHTPREMFPGLFETVQLSGIFPDNKIFADATAKRAPSLILKDYKLLKDQRAFDLKKFVLNEFTFPAESENVFKSDIKRGLRKHIDTLWHVLSRGHNATAPYSSLISLPNDFIIPGGRFREMYYWDSYFTMVGLQESHKTKIIQNMISNFAYLVDKFGFIPTGTRTYYLSRSQAPFFSLMVGLLAKERGDNIIVKYQPVLLKEYGFWMRGTDKLKPGQVYRNVVYMPGAEILNRYWDNSDKPREEAYKNDLDSAKKTKQKPADFYRNIRAAGESGWDFGSRWFDASNKFGSIQTTSMVPVDLNCLLYHLELTLARSYQLQGNKIKNNFYLNIAANRKKAIIKYCWSEKEKWFMDFNWKTKHFSTQQTIAGVFPLFFNVPNALQADKMAYTLKSKFLKQRGLATSFKRTGQQWDSPNGWAPMQYMAIVGLQNYHQNSLAKEIALRWMKTNTKVFNVTGKLTEKYNVSDADVKAGGGEYPQQDGYGWTNGVLLYLLNHYKSD